MDLQTLHFFRTVCREGSISAAAKRLDYAQSNLSARMSQMEKELGCTLLERSRDGIQPTDQGLRLLSYAERILQLSEEADAVLRTGVSASEELRIGAMESSALTFLPPLLAGYHTAHPTVRLTLSSGISGGLARQVLDRKLDGAVIAGSAEHRELSSVFLRKEPMVLVSGRNTQTPSLKALLQQPLIVFPYGCSYRRSLENLLEEKGVLADRVVEIDSVGAQIAAISAGLGVGLLPSHAVEVFAAREALAVHTPPKAYREVDIYFIYRKANEGNATLTDFAAMLRSEQD